MISWQWRSRASQNVAIGEAIVRQVSPNHGANLELGRCGIETRWSFRSSPGSPVFAVLGVYYIAKGMAGLSNTVDGIVTLIVMCAVGTLITRQAQTYGLTKKGKLGVGAKSMFGLFVLSWVLFGIGLALTMLA